MKNTAIKQKIGLACRFLKHKLKGQKLKLVTIEVTKRCNAKCPFCSYWQEPPQKELDDYTPIVKRFNPMVITLSGGEPFLRKDLLDIVKDIRRADRNVWISMVTNGWLLTPDKAKALKDAGMNQISISLDYAGEKHDQARVLPGLYKKITAMLPELAAVGLDIVSLNAVIKDDNMDDIPKILELAKESGVQVGLSSFCEMKNGLGELNVQQDHLESLKELIEFVKEFKKKHGVVTSSNYYLDKVIEYFQNGSVPGCRAGINWIQVTPSGAIKPCSEMPVAAQNYQDYNPKKATPQKCQECWFSCRGEAQAPIDIQRIKELW